MKISTKYGYAFLCTPKCASTSIESVIHKYSDLSLTNDFKHINAKKYNRYVVPLLKDIKPNAAIETICLMREPIDWLNSWYRYRSRKELSNPKHPKHKNYTGGVTFEEFLLAYIDIDRPSFAKVGKQHSFITLANGSSGIDKVFPFESLSKIEDYLSNKIGEKLSFPHKNISKKIIDKQGIDKALELKIKEFLKSDYELYESIC